MPPRRKCPSLPLGNIEGYGSVMEEVSVVSNLLILSQETYVDASLAEHYGLSRPPQATPCQPNIERSASF